MKFTDMLRALDDSDLDPFEVRYLIHIWRRGSCWETVRKIGESCQMSKSQANRVRQDLIAKGWIIQVVEDGRVVQKLAADVPVVDISNVVVVPVVDTLVPVVDKAVPVRHSLPINRTNEINPLNDSAPEPIGDDREGKQQAWSAIVELVEFWEQLTRRRRPADGTEDLREKWIKPFNEIWIICGRDVEAAKAKIQAVRDGMIARGGSIFDPAKLPAHIKVLSDAELLPMTQRMNGHRTAAPLVAMKEVAPGLF